MPMFGMYSGYSSYFPQGTGLAIGLVDGSAVGAFLRLRNAGIGKLTSHFHGWYTCSELLVYFVSQGICSDNNWSVRVG